MTTLIEQLIIKLGLRDEPTVLQKTTELMRLLELRSTNVPLQINEYAKIVLCADLASTILGTSFDKELALKVSGIRKSQYNNNKHMLEKLLDLSKLATVNEICVKLSLSFTSARKGEQLLDLYKNVVGNDNLDIDLAHPQYAAMAVLFACRLLKIKVSKPKLMPFSNLRPTQWQQLEQRWERVLAEHYKENTCVQLDTDTKMQQEESAKPIKSNKPTKPIPEDYEKWKMRMISMAQAKLKELDG